MVFNYAIMGYIDPASTGTLLYIIIALAASFLFTVRGILFSLSNFLLGKGFKKQNDFENAEIVFYSEGKQYWQVFKPVILALIRKGYPVVYLTSSKEDPGLTLENTLYKSKYIGNIAITSVYLKRLKATFVGMTTPQLDVMMIRRSKHVKHYAHIVHAPVDIFTYRKFAFDYFDSVFCSGPHQIENIRKLEEKRKTRKKILLETGLTYYDEMIQEVISLPPISKERPCVLVSPTWKEYSIINRFGAKFFEYLLADDSYDVILRPHPQTYISFPKLIAEIEERFSNNPRFSVDKERLGTLSMAKSDIMISDLSGIIWDYAFLFTKPVLLLKTDFESIEGFEGSELNPPMWEMKERKRIGREFDENELQNLPKIVKETLNNPCNVNIENLRNESVFNFGNAGEIAAAQIIEIIKSLKN